MKNKIEVKEEVREEIIIPKVEKLEENNKEEISYFFPNQRRTVRASSLQEALQKLNKE